MASSVPSSVAIFIYIYNKSLRKISLACREHEKVGDELFTHSALILD